MLSIKDIKPLLIVFTPRDFPLAKNWLMNITYIDKLFICYYKTDDAHRIAREFVEDKDYTHIIIATDDILATPIHPMYLIDDVIKYDFPVISGWCNYNFTRDWSAITLSKPWYVARGMKIISAGQYGFTPMSSMVTYPYSKIKKGNIEYNGVKLPWYIIKVWFNGNPLTMIRRDIWDKVPFRPYSQSVDRFGRRGAMYDLQFAIDLDKHNIPHYTDLRCFLLHFGNTVKYLKLKSCKPKTVFIKAKTPLRYAYGIWKKTFSII